MNSRPPWFTGLDWDDLCSGDKNCLHCSLGELFSWVLQCLVSPTGYRKALSQSIVSRSNQIEFQSLESKSRFCNNVVSNQFLSNRPSRQIRLFPNFATVADVWISSSSERNRKTSLMAIRNPLPPAKWKTNHNPFDSHKNALFTCLV